jgi:uncharacterized protein YecT (DUF1311 family)
MGHETVRSALIIAGYFAALMFQPTSAIAQSFDCSKASTKTEKMICAEPEISKLDVQMAARYKLLLSKDAEDQTGAAAAQARWLVETRNVAALAGELKQTYVTRLSDLDDAVRCATASAVSQMNQMEWNRCASIAFDNSNAQLNALYRKLLAQPDVRSNDEATAALKDSQNAWLKFRDVQCEWETFDSRGGSIHPMEVLGCSRVLTKERIKQLTPAR